MILTFKDQLGRLVEIPSKPKRIISVVPSQSELLFDLGLENQLVGITRFCVHPQQLRKNVPSVGGTKDLRFKRIRSLQPDLIIANKEENDEEQIKKLSEHFPIWISDVSNLEDAVEMISSLSEITETQGAAHEIIKDIEANFTQSTKPFASALYIIWNDPIMVAGQGTFIDDMMQKSGLVNIAPAERYPILSQEQIRQLNPDVILLSSEPFPFREVHEESYKTCFPKSESMLVDGEMFSWYGSRLVIAGSYLKRFAKRLKKRLQT